MSFYKILIPFVVALTLVFFFTSSSNPNLDSIKKESDKIILYDSDQVSKIITLDKNSQIIQIETYVDGHKDKLWVPNYNDISDKPDSVEFYGNGQIKSQGYLKNGKQHSVWQYFDREGHLLIQRYFSLGEPVTIWIWYNHNNHDKIDKYELYDDIRDNGSLTRYYRSGYIKETKSYNQKQLTGDYTLFFNTIDSNGNQLIQLQGEYGAGDDLGIKVGEWQKFEK